MCKTVLHTCKARAARSVLAACPRQGVSVWLARWLRLHTRGTLQQGVEPERVQSAAGEDGPPSEPGGVPGPQRCGYLCSQTGLCFGAILQHSTSEQFAKLLEAFHCKHNQFTFWVVFSPTIFFFFFFFKIRFNKALPFLMFLFFFFLLLLLPLD